MHRYQVARGFDPNTTDFAQFLGDPVLYKPIQKADLDRFEETEGKNLVYSRPPSPPTPYPNSQTSDESDTELGYSDTDTDIDFFDSDVCSILNPYGDINAHGYDDHRDIYNKPSDSNSSPFENPDPSSPGVDDLCAQFADLALG
ncbi:hypothetical protein V5O48_010086 [Marasmius crinis-equi]|uniref:Uncharacterized protein n=1 Tax=Marasmius crinis-equi TaxID=585013 RepID=A0ABR3F9D1_9AGAR